MSDNEAITAALKWLLSADPLNRRHAIDILCAALATTEQEFAAKWAGHIIQPPTQETPASFGQALREFEAGTGPLSPQKATTPKHQPSALSDFHRPTCSKCGGDMNWERCWIPGCAEAIDDSDCEECGGEGGWWYCPCENSRRFGGHK